MSRLSGRVLRHLSTLALAGVGLAVPASIDAAAPVAALEQSDGIRVGEDQTVEKEYGPIAMSNPSPGLPPPAPQMYSPDHCRQAAYCHTIPLEIVTPPTLRPEDEFFVTVTLAWETDQLPGVKVGDAEYRKPEDVNDLDVYVWTEPAEERPVEWSAGADRPEKARFFRPDKGRYAIVVYNHSGPNRGYTLKVEYKKEHLEPPFELLPPEFQPPPLPPSESVAAPVAGDEPEPRFPSVGGGAPAGPPAVGGPVAPASPAGPSPAPRTPVEIDPDPDFTNFADDAFDEQLAAPPTDVLTEKRVKAVGPPKPASTASLVFWLAVVPLALLVAGGLWFSRRGSAVLKLR